MADSPSFASSTSRTKRSLSFFCENKRCCDLPFKILFERNNLKIYIYPCCNTSYSKARGIRVLQQNLSEKTRSGHRHNNNSRQQLSTAVHCLALVNLFFDTSSCDQAVNCNIAVLAYSPCSLSCLERIVDESSKSVMAPTTTADNTNTLCLV